MQYTVDRIEEGIAVCEDSGGNSVRIQISFLPENVREGDILSVDNSGFVILSDETARRRKEIFNKQNSIFKKHN